MKQKEKYIAILDQPDPKNPDKFWMSGVVRTLSLKQAKPLLEKGKIEKYISPEPKRMVRLITPEGKAEEMSWGEYLKRRKRTNIKGHIPIPKELESLERMAKQSKTITEFQSALQMNPAEMEKLAKFVKEGQFLNWEDFWNRTTGKLLPKAEISAYQTTRGAKGWEKRTDEYLQAQIKPKIRAIPKELEPLAESVRGFESVRLWKLTMEGMPVDKANKIAQQLIDAGFIEKPPIGMVSKKVIPDFESFYNQAKAIKPKRTNIKGRENNNLRNTNMITEKEVMEVKQWLDKIKKKHGIKGQLTDKIVLEELEEEAKKKKEKARKGEKREQEILKEIIKERQIVNSELKMSPSELNSWRGLPAFYRAMKKYRLKFHFIDVGKPEWLNDRDAMVFWIEKGEIKGLTKFIQEMRPDDFMVLELKPPIRSITRLWWDIVLELN